MAKLSAVFELVDRISDKLDAIYNSGNSMIDRFENFGNIADGSFGTAVSAANGAAVAITSYNQSIDDAAIKTDFWTNSIGNYDKSALEAVYSTEELVNMGLKSADALDYEADIMAQCDKAAQELSQALDSTTRIQEDCAAAMEGASKSAESVAENDRVSAQTKDELKTATENAAQAYNELMSAQNEAQAAMENYDAVLSSGTASLDETQAAAERAAQASDNLVVANQKATSATEELSKATDSVSKETKNAVNEGLEKIQALAEGISAAKIAEKVLEIGEAVYDMAGAFSEAESTVVLATGATGTALDSLTDSMMNAYSVSKTGSLDDAAAAVGEINTRLGYTDEELEETTGLFLDFAAVTGGNAAKSVRSVTQLMNQWHVPADDMEDMLSKLTYAGQASGISVDTLSSQLINNKAVLDQLGFSLDEATAMFMNFELAGTNTSAVMMGFRSALANGAVSSLDELNAVFDEISSGAMTAADASELFGTRAGPAIVNAVKDGTLSLDGFVDALENVDGTLATTAEAAQTLDQKWEQSLNNVNAAFTEALEPTISNVSSFFADVVYGIGDFLDEHENLTKAIAAIGIGIGTVTLAITGFTAATKIARVPL